MMAVRKGNMWADWLAEVRVLMKAGHLAEQRVGWKAAKKVDLTVESSA